MSEKRSMQPMLHFFEPHEIADLKEAFKVDVDAENEFLKGYFFSSNNVEYSSVIDIKTSI